MPSSCHMMGARESMTSDGRLRVGWRRLVRYRRVEACPQEIGHHNDEEQAGENPAALAADLLPGPLAKFRSASRRPKRRSLASARSCAYQAAALRRPIDGASDRGCDA